MKKKKEMGMQNKTDIKVFILFLLDALSYPLDEAHLHEIVMENGYVGSFDFSECFSELKELGHILEIEEDGVRQYLISDTGRLVAAELQGDILESIREKSLQSAKGLLSLYKRGAVASAEVRERDSHGYEVVCKIADGEGTLLSLTLSSPSKAAAERMQSNFEKKPEETYRGILSVLTGEIDYLLH